MGYVNTDPFPREDWREDERLNDDIARRHREELSHASEFKCSGEHDPVSGACLKGDER